MTTDKFLALTDGIINLDSVARIRIFGRPLPVANITYHGGGEELFEQPDDVQALEWACELLTSDMDNLPRLAAYDDAEAPF